MENNSIVIGYLAPYLPYGLKVETVDGIFEVDGWGSEIGIFLKTIMYGANAIPAYKPVLRPMSDLTKEIEHNGKTFVPLIELYKWSNEHNYKKDLDYEFVDSWGAGKILKVFSSREKDEYTEFIYSDLSFRKDKRRNTSSYSFGMVLPHPIRFNDKIHNQYKLHQLLFEWHFDVFGLIDKGLAININDLKGETK